MKTKKFIALFLCSSMILGSLITTYASTPNEDSNFSIETESQDITQPLSEDTSDDTQTVSADQTQEQAEEADSNITVVAEEEPSVAVQNESEADNISEENDSASSYGPWEYQLSGSAVKITKYNGNSSSVAIPSSIDGYPVRTINGNTFTNNRSITTVTIPESITQINQGAFEGSSLRTLNYKAINCESMYGPQVFKNCTSFTTLNIDGNVESLPSSAFEGTYLTNVSIPSKITTVPSYCFKDCKNLTSANVGTNNLYIKNSAFSGCVNLTELILGNKTKELDSSCFYNCTSLTKLTIPQNVVLINSSAFEGCVNLTTLNYNATNCSRMNGSSVFKNCTNLTALNLGSNVTSIPSSAFENTNISGFTIPAKMTQIPNYAFKGCKNLTSINTGKNVIEIGYEAFRDCTNINKITFGNKLKTIDSYAFYNCISLPDLTLPVNLTYVNTRAFSYCISLKKLVYNARNCARLNGSSVFENCNELVNISITNNVQALPSAIFETIPIKKITIPSKITVIPDYAFKNCRELTSITLHSNITSINYEAFSGCTNLKSVKLDRKVTSISYSAFNNANSTLYIYCYYGSAAHKYAKEHQIKYFVIPNVPKSIKASGQKNAVRLTWQKSPASSGYVIYRSTSKNGTYKTIKTITKGTITAYTDSKLTKGKTYYYKIRAFRTRSNTKYYSSYSSKKYAKAK